MVRNRQMKITRPVYLGRIFKMAYLFFQTVIFDILIGMFEEEIERLKSISHFRSDSQAAQRALLSFGVKSKVVSEVS